MARQCTSCSNSSRLHCTTFDKPISCFSDKQIRQKNYSCYNAKQCDYIDELDTYSDPLTKEQILERQIQIINKHINGFIDTYEHRCIYPTVSWERLAELEYEVSENYFNSIESEDY